LEVTDGTVRVQVNQEETKVVSQFRIGKDIPNGMGQSKFESVEEYKYPESLLTNNNAWIQVQR
jgi:hypothetical protein